MWASWLWFVALCLRGGIQLVWSAGNTRSAGKSWLVLFRAEDDKKPKTQTEQLGKKSCIPKEPLLAKSCICQQSSMHKLLLWTTKTSGNNQPARQVWGNINFHTTSKGTIAVADMIDFLMQVMLFLLGSIVCTIWISLSGYICGRNTMKVAPWHRYSNRWINTERAHTTDLLTGMWTSLNQWHEICCSVRHKDRHAILYDSEISHTCMA